MKLKHKYESTGFSYALLHRQDFEFEPIIELLPTLEEAKERLEDIVTAYFEENETTEDDWEHTLEDILEYTWEARLGDVNVRLVEAEHIKRVD